MKIAFFTDTYYPQINGVTVSVDNFAQELRRKGHTVYIFAPKISGYEDMDPYVIRLSSVKVLSSEPEIRVPFFFPHKIVSQILPVKFDIVHAHGNGAFSILGYQIARMKDVPYVLTFHTQLTKYTHYILNGKVVRPRMVATGLRVFAGVCDGIITPSEKMKKELEGYGVKKNIQVIPNFVRFATYQKIKKRYLHQKFHIPQESKILLSVGRLGKEKNFPFIIKTFKKLTNSDKTTHLVIAGQGVEKAHLQELIKKLGLMERVHLVGRIDTNIMPQVYADSDVFVFASTTEVHPMVVLEAAASGLPLVVANDTAFAGVVEDNRNGYLLPLRQTTFVKTLKHLLQDAEERRMFGERSRAIVASSYDAEVVTTNLIRLYENTIRTYNPKIRNILKINRAALIRIQRTSESLERFFNNN